MGIMLILVNNEREIGERWRRYFRDLLNGEVGVERGISGE